MNGGNEYYPVHSQIVTVCPGFAAPRCTVTPPAGELQWVHWVRSILWLKRQDTHSTSEALCIFIQQRDITFFYDLIRGPDGSTQVDMQITTLLLRSPTLLAVTIWKRASLFPVVNLSLNLVTALLTAFSTDGSSQKIRTPGGTSATSCRAELWSTQKQKEVTFYYSCFSISFSDIYDIYLNETIWDWSCTPVKFTDVKFVLFSTLPKYFHLLLPYLSEENIVLFTELHLSDSYIYHDLCLVKLFFFFLTW